MPAGLSPLTLSEMQPAPLQTSKMEGFSKIVNGY